MVTLCCYLVYLTVFKTIYSNFLLELFQFTVMFWISEGFNQAVLSDDKRCLDAGESSILFGIDISFKVLLITYSVTVCCIVLFSFGVILYGIFEAIQGRPMSWINEPQIRRRRAVKVEELRSIEFHLDTSHGDEQNQCSICLEDFKQNEVIVTTPVCHHNFHKKCLQEWLNSHFNCPFCRSDIRLNLEIEL